MDGKLHRLELKQTERYDAGNTGEFTHHILYDSGTRIAVDITAEVRQAPLLSRVTPYDVSADQDIELLETYLHKQAEPVKDWQNAGVIPCVTGFEVKELVGDNYTPVREGMIALKDARKVLDDKIRELRQYCLRADLVTEQQETQV